MWLNLACSLGWKAIVVENFLTCLQSDKGYELLNYGWKLHLFLFLEKQSNLFILELYFFNGEFAKVVMHPPLVLFLYLLPNTNQCLGITKMIVCSDQCLFSVLPHWDLRWWLHLSCSKGGLCVNILVIEFVLKFFIWFYSCFYLISSLSSCLFYLCFGCLPASSWMCCFTNLVAQWNCF